MPDLIVYKLDTNEDDGSSYGVAWLPHDERGWLFPSEESALAVARKRLGEVVPYTSLEGHEVRTTKREIRQNDQILSLWVEREARSVTHKITPKSITGPDGQVYTRQDKEIIYGDWKPLTREESVPWEKPRVKRDFQVATIFAYKVTLNLAADLAEYEIQTRITT